MTISRLLATAIALAGSAVVAQTPAPAEIAPGIFLIEGGIEKGRQPDGNTVVLTAPEGLIVVDTGRHAWHRAKIEAFAAARKAPVAAIVNTHWHLDHVSGDGALKRAHPGAKVYASRAVEGALTDFLAKSAKSGREAIASGKLDHVTVEEIETDLATIAAADQLRPDVAIERPQPMSLAGRRLDVRLARHAATEGDVWLYDAGSRVAIVGDLVTLPAPFLDTACPEGWRRALAEVAATPFVTLVPGHGAPMTRAQFAGYRASFEALLDCAASPAAKQACVDAWVAAVTPLLGADERAPRLARTMTDYYVGQVLRGPDSRKYCPK